MDADPGQPWTLAGHGAGPSWWFKWLGIVQKGKLFVDVGFNIGSVGILVGAVGPLRHTQQLHRAAAVAAAAAAAPVSVWCCCDAKHTFQQSTRHTAHSTCPN